MARLIFILGGARSGKSRFAQQLAERIGGERVLFVATAEAGDDEMAERIAMHRASRPACWATREQPLNVGHAIGELSDSHEVVLIDCLTLLVSNVLLRSEGSDAGEVQRLLEIELQTLLANVKKRDGTVILVSSEVGAGLVPDNALGRLFRDLLGWANQSMAQVADASYLMVAGLAVEINNLAVSVEQAAQGSSTGSSIR